MTFDALLQAAAKRVKEAGSASARLDAEVLLTHVIKRDRTWLYTWGDRECPPWEHARFDALIAARVQGQPVAYLTGEREFWGLRLATSKDTLIPRPDTETLVEAALNRVASPSGRLLDLGTGTGAIALAFANEQPGWQVVGVDLRAEAVTLAQGNACKLAITNAWFKQSNWFSTFAQDGTERFDLIVSNPPYIAADDPHLYQGDVRFEPVSALVAAGDGLADLMHLIATARGYLTASGWLLLEHGYRQAADVRAALDKAGYQSVESIRDLSGHERITLGRI
ncbi:peptide chain release factor N(5)-glutamine methyltransferase [Vreelandella populi]|uniref:Release factor glutamine methyltransferase n=1 Tax=Vreelandella populi TaxID=2498858 RepID=A0A3S0WZ49_9GAMM|nr:peptide chain release factor N(5)-glutamine methyltransferase [Halomonas populi]RUR36049.1 peptide chain release factor N(5)-glutamine methyltransferase [Halomonas populi]RUR43210.1 peptide chain release factor N(5)-glutamine methyltransferase [Halomonas populi]